MNLLHFNLSKKKKKTSENKLVINSKIQEKKSVKILFIEFLSV